jgi:cell division protease FtsH
MGTSAQGRVAGTVVDWLPPRVSQREAQVPDEATNQDPIAGLDPAPSPRIGGTDVSRARERARQRRLGRALVAVTGVALWSGLRLAVGNPVEPGLPSINPVYGPALLIVAMLGFVLLLPLLAAGRSPHVLYRPEEIAVGLDDVVGAGPVAEEVQRTLELFQHNQRFEHRMGGRTRRGILFEGPPGTGKTHMAKAMAREAGVPFLFVSSSAFQSMYYGQTNRKIRSYFRALRRAARNEGGAIGFIEEIDAIGASRSGMGGRGDGVTGVVNELLIQLQSFDEPTRAARARGAVIEALNNLLPPHRRLRKPRGVPANVLVVAATNRADDLDPALLRPGRFDRIIHFGLPAAGERRLLLDHFLDRRAHHGELDDDAVRDALTALMAGYSPVAVEHVLDEALVWALRRGDDRMALADVHQARLTEELGLSQAVIYTEAERRRVATHEAGHATVAWLVSQQGEDGRPVGLLRRLEVLSIVKRRGALGLLAHADAEERFTRTERELRALIQIALGGLVAEELWFAETSTGPGGDLTTATHLAAEMVGALGMGRSLVSWAAADIGDGNLTARVLANDAARADVEAILDDARSMVTVGLAANAHVLEALRDALLERRELVGSEILDVIAAADAAGKPAGGPLIELP